MFAYKLSRWNLGHFYNPSTFDLRVLLIFTLVTKENYIRSSYTLKYGNTLEVLFEWLTPDALSCVLTSTCQRWVYHCRMLL